MTQLDPNRWALSPHAVDRILDMALLPEELVAACERPERHWISPKYKVRNQSAGRVTVALAPAQNGRRTVITVLWSTQEDWEKDYVHGSTLPGRERRTSQYAEKEHAA